MSKGSQMFPRSKILPFIAGSAVIVFVILLLSSCNDKSPSRVVLTKAWVNQTTQDSTSAYLAISVSGSDQLLSVSVPLRVAAKSGVYKTIPAGTSSFKKSVAANNLLIRADPLTVAATRADCRLDPRERTRQQGAFIFKPGGYYIKIDNLVQPLTAGGQIPLLLVFKQAGRVEVNAQIC